MKKTKLYHLTSFEAAPDIEKSGFLPGTEEKVWFALHPNNAWGAIARDVIFEILAPLREIEQFKSKLEIKDKKGEESPIIYFYGLPPETANKFQRRIISEEERHQLHLNS